MDPCSAVTAQTLNVPIDLVANWIKARGLYVKKITQIDGVTTILGIAYLEILQDWDW